MPINGWQTKPWTGVQIDPRQPLAVGLSKCVINNENYGLPIELVNQSLPRNSNGVQWTQGAQGSVLDFVASQSAYVQWEKTFKNFPAFATLACSFNTSATTQTIPISLTSKTSNTPLVIVAINPSGGTTGTVRATWTANSGSWTTTTTTSTYNDGEWHYVVATFDPNNGLKLYIDGLIPAQTQTGTLPIGSTAPVNQFCLGGLIRTTNTYYDVQVDTAMVWDRALSDAEAASLYANPFQIFKPQVLTGLPPISAFQQGLASLNALSTLWRGAGTIVSKADGSWYGQFGSSGYVVTGSVWSGTGNMLSSLPSWCSSFTPAGHTFRTWASTTSDIRGVQRPDNLSDRVAASWYTTIAMTFTININDGNLHVITMYCLDWDNGSRVQTIQVTRSSDNIILQTITASSFDNGSGWYTNIQVSTSVVITVTKVSGTDAAVSGFFFDEPDFIRQVRGGLVGF